MSLASLFDAKESNAGFQPLLLATVIFPDGQEQRYASRGIAEDETDIPSFSCGGYTWQGRILNDQLAIAQAMNASGLASLPNVRLSLADPDKFLFSNFEGWDAGGTPSVGWRGAKLVLDLILYDPAPANPIGPFFSTDSLRIFYGICEQPEATDYTLEITAIHRLNLGVLTLPTVHVQKRCPWPYPVTAAQKADADNPLSPFFNCGRYKLNGTEDANTSCDKTVENCITNGKYTGINTANPKGRYGGILYAPPQAYQGKSFLLGKRVRGVNSANLPKYADVVPLVYGTVELEPVLMHTNGAPDWTSAQAIVCYGEVGPDRDGAVNGNWRVWVNDYEQTRSYSTSNVSDSNYQYGWWRFLNTGRREGIPGVKDENGNFVGDPYGGLVAIEFGVVNTIAKSESLPSVRVRAIGPSLRNYQKIKYIEGARVILVGINASLGAGQWCSIFGTNTGNDGTYQVAQVTTGGINPVWALSADNDPDNWLSSHPGDVGCGAFDLLDPSGTGLYTGLNGVSAGWCYNQNFAGIGDTAANPAWVLYDLLRWMGWTYTEIDVNAFCQAAKICDESVHYKTGKKDENGTVIEADHERFRCNYAIRHPVAAVEALQGILNCMRATLVPREKLSIFIRGTLASQQPSPITGSNDKVEYSVAGVLGGFTAKKNDGTSAGTGYIAYHFNDSNIIRNDDGTSTLHLLPADPQLGCPRVLVQFQDEDNEYIVDRLEITDTDGVFRAGLAAREVAVDGVPNYDQAMRLGNTLLAEETRGNPRGTLQNGASGSWQFQFVTSHRAAHLNVGDIVALTSTRYKLNKQLFRVLDIRPSMDFEQLSIRLGWHDDRWYQDDYGQGTNPPAVIGDDISRSGRGPMIWQPYIENAPAQDALWPGQYNFAVLPKFSTQADGTGQAVIEIAGRKPVTKIGPPSLRVPMLTSPPQVTSGGSLLPDMWYYVGVVAGVKPAGSATFVWSRMTKPFLVRTTATDRTIVIPEIIGLGSPTVFQVFVGINREVMSFATSAVGPHATSVSIAGPFYGNTFGPPDEEADHVRVQVKRLFHAGIWGQAIDAIPAGNQIQIIQANFPDLTNRVITFLGKGDAVYAAQVPWVNLKVISNTTDTLTFNAAIDLSTFNIAVGDAACLRAQATAAGTDYIEDSLWLNCLNDYHLITGLAKSTVNGNWQLTCPEHMFETGDLAWIYGLAIDEAGTRVTTGALDGGGWTVTVIDAMTVEIDNSSAAVAYWNSGAWISREGMEENQEVGRRVMIIAGTGAGQERTIVSNTTTRLTVSPAWDVTPSTDPNSPAGVSVFIVVEEGWSDSSALSNKIDNSICPNDYTGTGREPVIRRGSTKPVVRYIPPEAIITMQVKVPILGTSYLVGAQLEDTNNRPSVYYPTREIYVPSFGGTLASLGKLNNLTEKDRATFGLGIGTAQAVGNDLTNHFMVRQPNGGGTFIEAMANCKTWDAAETLGLSLDIKKCTPQEGVPLENQVWNSIFPEGDLLEVPNKIITNVSQILFAASPNNTVAPGDWLRIDLMEGSAQTCKDIEVVVRWGV